MRLATSPYVAPTEDNIKNMFMHLTNYAINKNSKSYVQNSGKEWHEEEDNAHKRSMSGFFQGLHLNGYDVGRIKQQIDDLVIKTMILASPSLAHVFRSGQPDDTENQLYF